MPVVILYDFQGLAVKFPVNNNTFRSIQEHLKNRTRFERLNRPTVGMFMSP